MRRLKDNTRVPGGGWLARQPETGTVIKGLSFPSLLKRVRSYREANGLSIEPNLRRQVENQVCETLSEEERSMFCLDNALFSEPPELKPFRSTSQDLFNFGKALKGLLDSALAGTRLHVSQEEADSRAAVCSVCPHNLPVSNCWGCGALGSLYRTLIGNRKTSKDYLLKSCDVCGCDNRTQVHFEGALLKEVSQKQGFMAANFPEFCWKKELLQ